MQPPGKSLEGVIRMLRGQRVILDADLARIYGVSTKRLNQAVRRNARRFPVDFAFRITARESANWRSQIVTSSMQVQTNQGLAITHPPPFAPTGHGGKRGRPWAFTEHGALMAANVLRSERAVQMSVFVVRAFVQMRERLAADAAILKRLAEIDATLLAHDRTLREIWEHLQPLVAPGSELPQRRIGFHVKDVAGRPAERADPAEP